MLDPILKQNIYLICKEALNNVVKHAQATHVNVSLTSTIDSFTIRIEDNGLGYKDEAHAGNGIRNMKRRAQAIGGEFGIEHNKGTKITVQRKNYLAPMFMGSNHALVLSSFV
ncbi:MAG: ATP-binding protein [Cytophagales bacterium]|nr:ATP-binding protein [Cytophagales bacterium]